MRFYNRFHIAVSVLLSIDVVPFISLGAISMLYDERYDNNQPMSSKFEKL